MADITVTTTLDAVLYQGALLAQNGQMPIVGYNPEVTFFNADLVEVVEEWERQEFNVGGLFRRDTYRNAAGDIVRVSGWRIENPPVISVTAPITGQINGGNVALTLTGTNFGVLVPQIQVHLLFRPSYKKGSVQRRGGGLNRIAATVLTVADTSITATLNLNEEYRGAQMFDNQVASIVVQRLDRGLESDPINFTLTGSPDPEA